MMFGYGGSWPFWEAGLMWFGMIAILVLLIWGVYALVTSLTRKQGSEPAGDPCLLTGSRAGPVRAPRILT